jgi:hypothetical protein
MLFSVIFHFAALLTVEIIYVLAGVVCDVTLISVKVGGMYRILICFLTMSLQVKHGKLVVI